MSIETDARQAQRRMPDGFWREMSSELCFEEGYRQGAVWASEQADREPSDADVRAALSEWYRGIFSGGWTEQDEARMRAALLAAQEVRRG